MRWWCVVSIKSVSSDYCLFSLKGGGGGGGGGRVSMTKRKRSGKWRCWGINCDGEAILWQYCQPILLSIILPFFMRNFIVHNIEHIDFFSRLVHNNSCSKQHGADRCNLTKKGHEWRQYQELYHFLYCKKDFPLFVFLYFTAIKAKSTARVKGSFLKLLSATYLCSEREQITLFSLERLL